LGITLSAPRNLPPDDLPQRAWLAYLIQELTTPLVALLDMARGLALKARSLTDEDARTTSSRVLDRAAYLVETVNRLVTTDPVRLTADNRRNVRHDLRAAAGYIVSACEDLTESLPAEDIDKLSPELPDTYAAAGRMIAHIEAVVRFGAAEPGSSAASIRDVIHTLRERVTQATESADRSEPGRLLLVDDNEFNRDLVAKLLRSQGHTVETAAGGREAQARLKDRAASSIDVVLLDVLMPEVTGLDVLIWMRADPALWPIPVIMVSALGDDDGVLACISAGAEDYLTRPVRPELLRARIAGCLEKKRLRDRERAYLARIDRLVKAIFPPAAVAEWRATESIRPKRYDKVGVLFLDIVGFTAWCETLRDDPVPVVETLQELVVQFEETARKHGVQKIKTIGDAFMAVAGMADPDTNPAWTLLKCGLDLIAAAQAHRAGWNVRVGIHVGPVVTGVLGQTQFSFDVWGHTVNAAARTESNGTPGKVTLSAEAWDDVKELATGQPREVLARGLGAVTVWVYLGMRD